MKNNLLLLETSTTLCSVGISIDGIIESKRELNDGYTHAENLGRFIEECLSDLNLSIADLSAIAVGAGPGSYTGLRIGVSTAKGLAYGQHIPLISVNTMDTIAGLPEIKEFDGLVVPMLDARRLEVYTATYNTLRKVIEPTRALILTEESFSEQLSEEKIAFVGDGAAKFEALIKEHSNASFFPALYPSVEGMNEIAVRKYQRREFEDVAYYEPFYLKDFVGTTPKAKVHQ